MELPHFSFIPTSQDISSNPIWLVIPTLITAYIPKLRVQATVSDKSSYLSKRTAQAHLDYIKALTEQMLFLCIIILAVFYLCGSPPAVSPLVDCTGCCKPFRVPGSGYSVLHEHGNFFPGVMRICARQEKCKAHSAGPGGRQNSIKY